MAREVHGKTSELEAGDPCFSFVCRGYPALERYLQVHALSNQRNGYGRTFVFRGTLDGASAILGYYTLCASSIEQKELPRPNRHGSPRRIPVALLGRLAVDDRAQGQGIGRALLVDSLKRVHQAAYSVGFFAVIVDAKDERAEEFYKHFAFDYLPGAHTPRRMYLKVEVLDELIGKPSFLEWAWGLVSNRMLPRALTR